MIQKQNNMQSGRSMVEMLAVLGVIGTISVGVMTGIGYGLSRTQATVISTNVQRGIQDIQEMCSWEGGNYKNCFEDETTIKDFKDDDKSVRGNWKIVGEDGSFTVTIQNVPQRACRQMVNSEVTHWEDSGVSKITVDPKGGDQVICEVAEKGTISCSGCKTLTNGKCTWADACPTTPSKITFTAN